MKRALAQSVVAAVCAALLAASSAAAQGPAPRPDRAAALALFEAGRDLMDRGQYKAACEKFEASLRTEPAVGTVLNLGNCYEKTGRLASAWERFEEAGQKLAPGDDRLPVATARAAALKPRLPRLELTLDPGAPTGTQVLRDDVPVDAGALGVAIPVDPGSHRVVVKAPGHEDAAVSIDVLEGKLVQRRLSVGAPVAAPTDRPTPVLAPATPAASSPLEAAWWSPRRAAGVAVGGVGLAGLAAGFVAGGLTIGEKNTVSQSCNPTTRTCSNQAALDAASIGKTAATVSTVSFVLGAAAAGTGLVLVVIGAPAQGPATGAVTVRGMATPGGGALALRGAF